MMYICTIIKVTFRQTLPSSIYYEFCYNSKISYQLQIPSHRTVYISDILYLVRKCPRASSSNSHFIFINMSIPWLGFWEVKSEVAGCLSLCKFNDMSGRTLRLINKQTLNICLFQVRTVRYFFQYTEVSFNKKK